MISNSCFVPGSQFEIYRWPPINWDGLKREGSDGRSLSMRTLQDSRSRTHFTARCVHPAAINIISPGATQQALHTPAATRDRWGWKDSLTVANLRVLRQGGYGWTRGPGQVGSREVSRCRSDGSE
ncbi:uncharacterized protein N7469_002881 [Penicillium citrinum]|uniref:Uncharacterized protein n=2 Tax=Penicillium TaxID=5073 RepID=A0A9W9PBF4_PENCI|nr:uncharacterized protein N7469_002881 [Penicillium citrinum]KAJ5241290.1 hypothetical protein N7469_002881 [Penicillium citrinum]KAJ5586292.1 hypothetical protein N7450_006079 [Penicillium hetheringtonii]